jgi:hypothetical protein
LLFFLEKNNTFIEMVYIYNRRMLIEQLYGRGQRMQLSVLGPVIMNTNGRQPLILGFQS